MKAVWVMLCLSSWLLSGTVMAFEVTQYNFTWNIAAAGKAALVIQKTPEAGTQVILKSTQRMMGGDLKLTPENAEALGKTFLKVDQYYNLMKDKNSDTATEKVGGYKVLFSQSSSGFWVTVTPPDSIMGFGQISLDREGIKAVTQPLLESIDRVKFFDERILF